MKEEKIYNFLKAFFTLFNAQIVEYHIDNDNVCGSVVFDDDDDDDEKQNFVWNCGLSKEELLIVVQVCKIIHSLNLNNGDKILVTETYFRSILIDNGFDKTQIDDILNTLFSIEIRMVDDGKLSDSFFLHM